MDKSRKMEIKKEKERLDVMLDLETLGTSAGSIVLSVAFKTFSLDDSIPLTIITHHQHVSIISSLLMHMTSDFNTEEWWNRQSEEARQRIQDGQKESVDIASEMILVYELFKQWNENYDLHIWGRGVANFDLPILDEAMRRRRMLSYSLEVLECGGRAEYRILLQGLRTSIRES